ncbi:hypothetical protein [Agromyces sp. SYSU T00266]
MAISINARLSEGGLEAVSDADRARSRKRIGSTIRGVAIAY